MISLTNSRREMRDTMCTFGFGKIEKMLCLMFAISMFVIGCKENKTDQIQRRSKIIESEKLERDYESAVKQAENNNPAGFLKLYEIASKSLSAENSEIARDKLNHLLYAKTELWINTFSKTDLEKFKHFLRTGGLATLELPKSVESENQFREELLTKLRKIKGNKNETELIKYIIKLYESKGRE